MSRSLRRLRPPSPYVVLCVSVLVTLAGSYYVALTTVEELAVLFLGLLASATLFVVSRAQVSARAAAERAAGELLRSEAALRESEERIRLTLDHALDAVVVIDRDGRIVGWHARAEALFGWPRAEALGRPLAETIIPPAYREAHRQGLARYLATGEGPALNRRIELSALRRDGSEVPVELAITPVRLAGEILFSAFVRDISDRKAAERTVREQEGKLREREASFRLLFESNPHPMWVYDIETLAFLEVNDAAVAAYGYSREEFLRMRIADIRPPEDVRVLVEFFEQRGTMPARGLRHSGEWRHRRKDGTVVDVQIDSHAIEFAGRRATLVVAQDVSELKRARATLAQLAERLEILHTIDAAIIAADAPEAIAEAVVRSLRDLLGVPRAIVNVFDLENGEVEWLAAAGRRRIHVGPGVRYPMTLAGGVEGLRRGEPQVIDVDALPPSPETKALLASGVHTYVVVPMVAGGELVGSISLGKETGPFSREQLGIAQEVAAQLAIAMVHARLHARVKRDAVDLEQRVKERTRELSVANEQLREASRLKSDFLANMSHELRTPLNAVIGFAELIHDGKAGPINGEQTEYLGDILTSSRHLLQLINDVLDLSKVEAGKMVFRPERIGLAAVVGEVRDTLRTLAAQKRIEVAIDIEPALETVVADAGRLKQILYNYLSNALKFTPDGGRVDIRVRAERDDMYRLEVEDTGIGIEPEHSGKLFTEFQQLDSGLAKRYQGTGLGLALTKRMVEAQGGRVGVESTPGKGSVFFAVLPRSTPEARRGR